VRVVVLVVMVCTLGAWTRPSGWPLYERFCLACHGERGDGRGPAAAFAWPAPRDLTRGDFKWRSVPVGQAATDDDLRATIRLGAPGTSMPGFPTLSAAQLDEVLAVVRSFAPAARAGTPIALGVAPAPDPARGAALWQAKGCAACHPSRAYDLATGLRRPREPGSTRRAAALSIATGMGAMPAYAGVITDAELWALADHVVALASPRALPAAPWRLARAAPADPAAPSGPTRAAPAQPAAPSGPTRAAPADPAAPSGPTRAVPAQPAAPSGPTRAAPADPAAPSGPTRAAPAQPAAPSGPTRAAPADPAAPSGPTRAVPADPAAPSGPTRAAPAQPAAQSGSTRAVPAQPAAPSGPTRAAPAEPAAPSGPTRAAPAEQIAADLAPSATSGPARALPLGGAGLRAMPAEQIAADRAAPIAAWPGGGDDAIVFGAPVPPQGPPPASLAPAQASLHARPCGRCHAAQLRAWQPSIHGAAASPGLLAQTEFAMPARQRANCLRCHAPLAEQASDPQLLAEGVSCAGCHLRGWVRQGPPHVSSSLLPLPGYPAVQRGLYERADLCLPCHQLPPRDAVAGRPLLDTYREWLHGPYMPRGIQCQHCHFPERAHTVLGVHDRETFRQGIALTAEAHRAGPDVSVLASVANVGAGHFLPTTTTPAAWLAIALIDAHGQPIAGASARYRIGRDVWFDGTWHERADTRIPPGESLHVARAWRAGRTAEAAFARITITVHPDDYYERFYTRELAGTLAPAQRALYQQALARALANRYVAEQLDVAVSAAAHAPTP
jgi:hypothetical protein